ncbi:hypothetical protein MMC29_002257 [Sticta canariensis]|nr:hypothetical protein [Sticta canariensis]
MLANHIAPIFGNPKAMYTDNGSHFVNQLVEKYTEDNGIIHYTGLVSHLLSTRLLEQSVQSMISYLRSQYLEKGIGDWSMDIRERCLYMSTKQVKIYGYTPAELMLGFNPELKHYDVQVPSLPLELEDFTPTTAPRHQLQIFSALCDEKKLLASEAAAYATYNRGHNQQQQRLPEPGDLVIVRNHQIDK